MTLSYEDIYSYFLGYITDFNLASMEMNDAYELMGENLQKALAKPHVMNLFSSFDNDKEIMKLSFEMENKGNDDYDLNFVQDIIAKGMVVEWLQPQVKSKLLTSQYFGTSEKKFFAQANHLSELKELLEQTKLEQRKMIRDRDYAINSYLGD